MKFSISSSFLFGIFVSTFSVNLSLGESGDVGDNHLRSTRVRTITTETSYFYNEPQYPKDCEEVYEQWEDETESGIYTIQPEGSPGPFKVFCDNAIDGGKWTVFQRREDGSVEFHRDWAEYKTGFGFLNREFWLGNDNLAYLTSQKNYELRIDMKNANGEAYYAKYDLFRISDEGSKYRLVDLGTYLPESTAGQDSLAFHRGMAFSTRDADNDDHVTVNCASDHGGAWWFNDCDHSDLNGNYFTGTDRGIEWTNLAGGSYGLKYSEMKIRAI